MVEIMSTHFSQRPTAFSRRFESIGKSKLSRRPIRRCGFSAKARV
jgi:hypothetical protein